jgi:hypothetical protein
MSTNGANSSNCNESDEMISHHRNTTEDTEKIESLIRNHSIAVSKLSKLSKLSKHQMK